MRRTPSVWPCRSASCRRPASPGLTLGGGTGYLTRKYGLTIDNLLEADVVLADGSVRHGERDEHPDLFWALRGGGGNFGVVTSFLFQAHPVKQVYAGPIFWDAKDAQAVMRAYRDFLPTAPEELGHLRRPEDGAAGAIRSRRSTGASARARSSAASTAPAATAQKAMAPLLGRAAAAAVQLDGRRCRSRRCKGLFDPFFPKGLQWYWKGDFVKALTDEAIDTHIAQAANAPSELSLMHLYPIDGAVRRVPKDGDRVERARRDVVDGHRRHRSPIPTQAEALKTWGRAYWKAVHPFNLAGAYVNFMMDDEARRPRCRRPTATTTRGWRR